MNHHFKAQLSKRSVSVTITETLDTVYIHLSCTDYDNLQEDHEYISWLYPILYRYENDRRKVIITSDNSERTGVIESIGDNLVSYMY